MHGHLQLNDRHYGRSQKPKLTSSNEPNRSESTYSEFSVIHAQTLRESKIPGTHAVSNNVLSNTRQASKSCPTDSEKGNPRVRFLVGQDQQGQSLCFEFGSVTKAVRARSDGRRHVIFQVADASPLAAVLRRCFCLAAVINAKGWQSAGGVVCVGMCLGSGDALGGRGLVCLDSGRCSRTDAASTIQILIIDDADARCTSRARVLSLMAPVDVPQAASASCLFCAAAKNASRLARRESRAIPRISLLPCLYKHKHTHTSTNSLLSTYHPSPVTCPSRDIRLVYTSYCTRCRLLHTLSATTR
jgi:hypothetical protein